MDPDPAGRPASAADLRSAIERARPQVSWRPVGTLAWDGCAADGAQWSVVVRDQGGHHVVETSRELGKGARRVSAGCSETETAGEARRAAREVLDSLAMTGTF